MGGLWSALFCLNFLQRTKKPAMQTFDYKAFVDQYFTHFNHHDWHKIASLYAENAAFKDPSLGPGMVPQSRQQIIAKYSEMAKVFPDLRDEVLNVYPSGQQHVIVEFVSKGTAPDGSTFELPICTIFTVENGLITQDFTYYDNLEE